MPHYLNIDDDEDDREWVVEDDEDENFNYTFYKILKKDCECYVGSTRDLKERIRIHKYKCNTEIFKNGNKNNRYDIKLYQYIRGNGGFDTFDFEVLDTKYCNKKQAEIYESALMKIHNAKLNVLRNYSDEDKKNYQKEYEKNEKKNECAVCNCFIKRNREMKNHILTKKHIKNLENRIKQLEEEEQNLINITINIQNLNINLPQD
tara:strand:- start:131 stop:745 length:615 start_codon:yes stop_codon:yes gene_type:complete